MAFFAKETKKSKILSRLTCHVPYFTYLKKVEDRLNTMSIFFNEETRDVSLTLPYRVFGVCFYAFIPSFLF